MGGFASNKPDIVPSVQEKPSVTDTASLNNCRQLTHESLHAEIRHAFSKGMYIRCNSKVIFHVTVNIVVYGQSSKFV